METEECICGRRSVRAYSGEDVTDGDVEGIVDLARFAPSWANTQCVRFLAVRDPAVKGRLADVMSERNPGKEAVRKAPVVVVFLARTDLAGYKKGVPVDGRTWHLFDAGSAVQTFCLAAHARGFGTVIVGYFDARKASGILEVPAGFEVVAFTPLGRPEKIPPTPSRKDVRDLLFWERFEGP